MVFIIRVGVCRRVIGIVFVGEVLIDLCVAVVVLVVADFCVVWVVIIVVIIVVVVC